ncbi:MAG: hypothetical protein RIT15_391, partial [Pseudomonadota bacterium]
MRRDTIRQRIEIVAALKARHNASFAMLIRNL